VSGGLHGVGISVVNALSEKMVTRVRRDGWEYEITFERGATSHKLKKLRAPRAAAPTSGSKRDPEVFETLEFSWKILENRLRELAFLNRGLAITLRDERGDEVRERVYSYEAASSRSSTGSTRTRNR